MRNYVRAALAGVRPAAVVPSPNIWNWPEVYEIENRAQDHGGVVWRALREDCPFAGLDVVDVGCGDGFHLPEFAASARGVVGVEPHRPLLRRARQRIAGLTNVELRHGSAERLPLADNSVDVVHARTAYFFGPGCERGMAEADRVLRPGGALVIVDLDATSAPYGTWLREDLPGYDSNEIEEFFTAQGFSCRALETLWRFQDRESLAAVLRIEFSPSVAERAIAQTTGLTLPVGYRMRLRRKPSGLLVP
ncbi:class I SAM-dependent methyltransferase [Allokutzneria sp. A3M-2-11 16]|uniref:class I SAM-dependent methyltransferase n=1 Tax=Allokutzneria sp. A3M-2-11 16 TaxID=2962043 RepID=UPI0020B8230F|nr:class I SAM-dependent methyltransferase [Allokutzneria sp. A3M-2-11 16]MCP3797937.1 class I SAM-dependent methyltransferase [Allokutzneria sp. A3M-2-11 16]